MLSINAFKRSEDLALGIINAHKIKRPAVPIEEIIKKIGLDIFEYNLGDDVSGVLVITNNRGTIGYNPKDNYLRQRFTMAHELGHFLMHRSNSELFVDKDFLFKKFRNANSYTPLERRQEQEANAFAAALLMPKKLIDGEMADDKLRDMSETDLVFQLAKRFKVSEVAMSYRLANLNSYF